MLIKVPNNVCNMFGLSLGLSKPMVHMVPPALLGTRTCPGAVSPGLDLQVETSSVTSFHTFMSRCNRAELENSNALAPGWAPGHVRGVYSALDGYNTSTPFSPKILPKGTS
jgi:hypothetical protein